MKISKFYVLLVAITCLYQLFAPSKILFAAVPVQIRINISAVTENQVAKQIKVIKQLQLLFKNNQVQAGFWFSGSAYRKIKAYDPAVVKQLFDNNFLIAHHGANRGNKGERPIDKMAELDWDNAVSWAVNYEHLQDGGGLSQLQNDFNNKIHVTGRFFLAPILQATKQIGCEAMIGLKEQLKAPSNAAWYMGMFNLPDRITIMPDKIRRAALNPGLLFQQIDQLADKWPDQSVETITILVHDKDFLRGELSGQQQFWSSYSALILWVSKNPDLETLTYEDLKQRVIDDRRQLLAISTLAKAVQQLVKLDSLPLYLLVDNIPLSMADLFYSLSSSLMSYHSNGKLPKEVQVENVLGPVVADNGGQPVFVTGKEILSSLASWRQMENDRIPESLRINRVNVNSASLLFAMAEIFNNIYQGKPFPKQIQIKKISIFPAQTENCSDTMSRLQFWTYKPQRPVLKIERTKTVNKIDNPVPAPIKNTPIYVTIYSHNEENSPWIELIDDQNLYKRYRSNLIKKVKLIHEHGAALSWQSDFVVLQAMLKYEKGSILKKTNNKNILRWMLEDMEVEITPHGHLTSHNYADISFLIEKLGVTPAPVIGGFALYTCNKKNLSITERIWQNDLEIHPDSSITGRNYPASTWKPKILVQPAMIGHVFDEFSSGVWKPDTRGNFTEHDSAGQFIVIGQGYPHYVENLGPRMAGGAVVRSVSLGYIKELSAAIQSTPEMQGRIYTASIHTRDYPTQSNVDTYDALNKTLTEIDSLVRSQRVIFMNYEDIATVWLQKYKGVSNRYPIEKTSLSHVLQQDLQKYCQKIAAGKQSPKMNLKKCGDGICDAHEQRTGFCKKDCLGAGNFETSKEMNSTNQNLCGDGICDTHEQQTDMCKQDCSSQKTSNSRTLSNSINFDLCGDGICDGHEERSGMCPRDCK